MIIAVDTCILLDILKKDKTYFKTSYDKLNDSLQNGKLIICEVVAAELAPQFRSVQDLEVFLTDTRIEIVSSSRKSLYMAGQGYIKYLSNRKIVCTICGESLNITCSSCRSDIRIRQHLLPDFLIASHASEQANSLLTRDLGYYKTYFPDLTLL